MRIRGRALGCMLSSVFEWLLSGIRPTFSAYGSMIRDYVASSNTMSPNSRQEAIPMKISNNWCPLYPLLFPLPTMQKSEFTTINQQATLITHLLHPGPHLPQKCKYLLCNLPWSSHSLITPSNPPPTSTLPKPTPAPGLPALHYGFPVGSLRGDRTLIKIVNEDLIFHFKWASELWRASRAKRMSERARGRQGERQEEARKRNECESHWDR